MSEQPTEGQQQGVPPSPWAQPGPYAAPQPGPAAYPPQPGPYAAPQPGPAAYPRPPGYPPAPGAWAAPQPPWAAGGPGVAGLPPLATWGDRVLAYLVDVLYQLPGLVVYFVGLVVFVANAPTTTSAGRVIRPGNPGPMWMGIALTVLGFLGMAVVMIYNHVIAQGRTGQSWGKRRLGLRVQDERTGATIGIGMNFVRQLAHVVDGAAYLGYLWPLWDPMRQTFADKIMHTVVVKIR